jgi:hypothetical protein
MTLEELAEKFRDYNYEDEYYSFTLPQLRELIKEVVGSPVAYRYDGESGDSMLDSSDMYVFSYSKTPLHALSVGFEDV